MMKRWSLALALAFGLAGAVLTAPPAEAQIIHTVGPDDTLTSIAQRYGTTVTELRWMNNISGDNIRVGQRLTVRRGGERIVVPIPDDDEVGDVGPSLPGVRPDDLVAPVPIATGPPPPPPPPATITRVPIGTGGRQPFSAVEPTAEPEPGGTETRVHVVAAGETLFSLARRYGTTVEALRTANRISGDNINVGQRLTVSGARGAVATAPVERQRAGRYDVRRSTLPDDEIHAVLPGETLFSIAARYGTTVGRLLAVNSGTTGPIPPGTLLALPDGVGRRYYREPAPFRVDEEGLALIYPASYAGRPTISGEAYDPAELTASHRTLPFGTVLLVTSPDTELRTLVRINDRGPVSEGFLIELSGAAARALGLESGSAQRVTVQVLR